MSEWIASIEGTETGHVLALWLALLAAFLHALAEAYAFAWNLRYAPTETRRMTTTEHNDLMALFPANFWNTTIADLNNIKNAIEAKY